MAESGRLKFPGEKKQKKTCMGDGAMKGKRDNNFIVYTAVVLKLLAQDQKWCS